MFAVLTNDPLAWSKSDSDERLNEEATFSLKLKEIDWPATDGLNAMPVALRRDGVAGHRLLDAGPVERLTIAAGNVAAAAGGDDRARDAGQREGQAVARARPWGYSQ